LRLRVLPEAAEDIDAAYAWYLAAPPTIRRRLHDEIDAALTRIQENPAQFPKIEGEFRRVLLSTFPLAVFYRDLPDEAVVVMVFPLRKDPGVLKQRLATSSTK
jgi:plasmid stabilization system protein ParE